MHDSQSSAVVLAAACCASHKSYAMRVSWQRCLGQIVLNSTTEAMKAMQPMFTICAKYCK